MTKSRKSQKVCKKILVVGLGLIGASFASAIKKAKAADIILGSTRSEKTLKSAIRRKIIDGGSNDLETMAALLQRGDVILIATPTLAVADKLAVLGDALARGVIVTDAASVKGDIAAKAKKIFGEIPEHLILGHPIAGSEKSGLDAADATLYADHRVILTPFLNTNKQSLNKVSKLWRSVGARVSLMDAEEHDRILAATSHLPHVLAFALVDALAKQSRSKDIFAYAAGGFRDFTRIAGSDPHMWHDIVVANRSAILAALDHFEISLSELRAAVDQQDSKTLISTFTNAKKARDRFGRLHSPTPRK